MKRSFIIFVLIFSMILSLSPVASADFYVSLGETFVGQIGYVQVLSDANGASSLTLYDSNGDGIADSYLPSGLYLESAQDPASGIMKHYLKGMPSVAGDFSFTLLAVYADGNTSRLQYNLVVTPSFSVNPVSQACQLGDSVSFSAQALTGDGSPVSYQWYSSSLASGDYRTPISGATSPSLTIPVSAVETTYYLCEATISSNGKYVSAFSSVAQLSVMSLSSLTITKKPNKTSYSTEDKLDTTGIEFRATYSDGSTRVITDTTGMTFTPSEFSESSQGLQTITVSWNGVSCVFPVQIEAQKKTIEIVSMPVKTSYRVGDTVDTTGLKLRVSTGTGYNDVTTGFTISPTKLTRSGQQQITVIYGDGVSTVFNVSVQAAEVEEKIEIISYPSKLNYSVGEKLETSGLILRVWTGDKYEDKNTGFTCEPLSFDRVAEKQTVTVKYGKKSVTFTVSVTEAAAAESPSPSVEVTVEPSPRATLTVEPAKSSKSGSSAPVAIIVLAVIIALAALAGAIVYIYMLRKSRLSADDASDYDEEVFAPEKEEIYRSAASVQRKSSASTAVRPDAYSGADERKGNELEPKKKDYFKGLFDDK